MRSRHSRRRSPTRTASWSAGTRSAAEWPHSPSPACASPGAVARTHAYAGLVCLSYPLHRPGGPESRRGRSAHWPAIDVPALLLSGTSDPFARIELLEAAMPTLRRGTLVTYPKLGHGLLPVREDVLDRIAAFVAGLDGGPEPGR